MIERLLLVSNMSSTMTRISSTWRENKINFPWDQATEQTGLSKRQVDKYLHDQNKKFRDANEKIIEKSQAAKSTIIFEIHCTKTNRDSTTQWNLL